MSWDERQENGQRILGPPRNWRGPVPQRGSEVFVGGLPRDASLSELLAVLERAGKVFQVRVMVNFSGECRGYALVKYENPRVATLAVSSLHGVRLRSGVRVGVFPSVENRRLVVTGLDRGVDVDALRRLAPGLRSVESEGTGRWLLVFHEHGDAARARRQLSTDYGVDWDFPETQVSLLLIPHTVIS